MVKGKASAGVDVQADLVAAGFSASAAAEVEAILGTGLARSLAGVAGKPKAAPMAASRSVVYFKTSPEHVSVLSEIGAAADGFSVTVYNLCKKLSDDYQGTAGSTDIDTWVGNANLTLANMLDAVGFYAECASTPPAQPK